MSDRLEFRVRHPGDSHPSFTVVATGNGPDFRITCDCMASLHGAPICRHIVAVLREESELIVSGARDLETLNERAKGSQAMDPENGYWHFYPERERE